MKNALAAALLLAVALPAPAQVDVQIRLGLAAAPPLVVVQPGIQVVENYEDEVFFHSGWYWVRRPPYWYRARAPRAAFVLVEPRHVPAPLVRLPPGQYRHWRAEARHEHREREKDERKRAKAARKAHKEWEKEQRRDHGHGHGHDRDRHD